MFMYMLEANPDTLDLFLSLQVFTRCFSNIVFSGLQQIKSVNTESDSVQMCANRIVCVFCVV